MKFKTNLRVKDLTATKKREFSVVTTDSPISTDSYFDGGTISYFRVVNMITGQVTMPNKGQYPWTTKNEYTLQPGDVMIETGSFCGKPATPTFHCLPGDFEQVKSWLRNPEQVN